MDWMGEEKRPKVRFLTDEGLKREGSIERN